MDSMHHSFNISLSLCVIFMRKRATLVPGIWCRKATWWSGIRLLSHNRFVEIKDIVDKISEGESTHYIPVVLHV